MHRINEKPVIPQEPSPASGEDKVFYLPQNRTRNRNNKNPCCFRLYLEKSTLLLPAEGTNKPIAYGRVIHGGT